MKVNVLTVKEAADYLGCCEKTIRNRIGEGAIRVAIAKKGEETMIGIRRSELDRYRRESKRFSAQKPEEETVASVEISDIPELFSEEVYQAVEQMSVTANALSTDLESFLALNVQVYESIKAIAENVVALQTIINKLDKERNNG